jgi:hypothetical protein
MIVKAVFLQVEEKSFLTLVDEESGTEQFAPLAHFGPLV